MIKKLIKNFRYFDYPLIIAILLLCSFGLVMVYSASMSVAVIVYKGASNLFFIKQVIWLCLGIIVLLVTMNIPYAQYYRKFKVIILGAFILLSIVLLIGKTANNAQSWLSFGGFNIQPAELAKLAIIVYLSAIYSRKQNYINDFMRAVFPPLTLTGFIFILVFVQPDLGTGLIILMIAAVITACSGMPRKQLLTLIGGVFLIGILVSTFFIQSVLTDVQYSRITGTYHPFEHEKAGYHLINSYIAIASGGISGKGLGESVQKYGYLPEPHTDFIISVIAEELGFFGVLFVIGLLMFIVARGFIIAIRCKDLFGSLMAIGISSMVAIQAIVNLGSATGLLPVTGVTLPFVSYGGTSIIILMISMGMLLNISRYVNEKRESKKVVHQSYHHSV